MNTPLILKKLDDFIQSAAFKDNECFRIPKVRDLLVLDRFKNIYQSEIITTSSNSITDQTILHNSSLERMFYSEMSERPDLISKPLSCMNSVMMNSYKMKVLSVGCRTEAEIFSLVDAGFEIENITGIDLFSYTPKSNSAMFATWILLQGHLMSLSVGGSWSSSPKSKKRCEKLSVLRNLGDLLLSAECITQYLLI